MITMRSFAWCLLFVVSAGMGSGCGSRSGLAKVHGIVTFDGKPMENATVYFMPSGGSPGQHATGMTGPDGSFDLTTGKDFGAYPGDYTVTVQYDEGTVYPAGNMKEAKAGGAKNRVKKPPKYVVPAIYGDATKSPLKQKVPPDGPVKLEIHSK
jgi:hypothetical protein